MGPSRTVYLGMKQMCDKLLNCVWLRGKGNGAKDKDDWIANGALKNIICGDEAEMKDNAEIYVTWGDNSKHKHRLRRLFANIMFGMKEITEALHRGVYKGNVGLLLTSILLP